ncbi:MAG: ABC transporter ATP-binding protein, partial [Pseudomonadota bacterium]
DIDNELNQQAFVDTLPKFALDPRPLDVAVYDRFATFMTDAGLVKDLPPLQTYATELPEPK